MLHLHTTLRQTERTTGKLSLRLPYIAHSSLGTVRTTYYSAYVRLCRLLCVFDAGVPVSITESRLYPRSPPPAPATKESQRQSLFFHPLSRLCKKRAIKCLVGALVSSSSGLGRNPLFSSQSAEKASLAIRIRPLCLLPLSELSFFNFQACESPIGFSKFVTV